MYEIIIITLVTVLANFVGILSGFGTGTILTPTLLLFLPFESALLISSIIVWFHNIFKTFFFRGHINWQLMLYFGLPGVITAFIGAMLVTKMIGSQWLLVLPVLLGAFLIFYVLFLFVMPHFKLTKNNMTSIFGGSFQGFFAGLFGIKGPIRTVFLTAYDLPKNEYLGTIGAISILVDSTRVATYWLQGLKIEKSLLSGLLIFIPASYVGSKAAEYLVSKIPQKHFRTVVAFFLLIIGLQLLLFPYQSDHL